MITNTLSKNKNYKPLCFIENYKDPSSLNPAYILIFIDINTLAYLTCLKFNEKTFFEFKETRFCINPL